jgi:hypothetical protein
MQPFDTARRFQVMSDAWNPGTGPEAEHKELSTTEARQGVSGLGVRYVLAISLSAVLAAFAIVYYFFFAP